MEGKQWKEAEQNSLVSVKALSPISYEGLFQLKLQSSSNGESSSSQAFPELQWNNFLFQFYPLPMYEITLFFSSILFPDFHFFFFFHFFWSTVRRRRTEQQNSKCLSGASSFLLPKLPTASKHQQRIKVYPISLFLWLFSYHFQIENEVCVG